MIEQGLVALVNSSNAVQQICTKGGGYMDQAPPTWDQVTPTWTWTHVSEVPEYGLQYQPGLTRLMWQIDCYGLGATSLAGVGPQGADCLALFYAIDKVLSGAGGGTQLTDPQQTRIDSIFRIDRKTEFDSAGRTYRVMAEYRVNYFAQTTGPNPG